MRGSIATDHGRRAAFGALALAALLTLTGCPKKPPAAPDPELAARNAQYRRIAIVCAPAPGAPAGHCPAIMEQVQKMAPSRLDFLETVDLLGDAKVDAAYRPPAVRLKNASAYDGIVALVYSTPGPVVLDIFMIDPRTNAEVWHQQLSTEDKDVPARLARHGFWTPTTLKQFYGR